MTNRRLACITLDLEPDWVGPGLSESYRVFEDDAAFGELDDHLGTSMLCTRLKILTRR